MEHEGPCLTSFDVGWDKILPVHHSQLWLTGRDAQRAWRNRMVKNQIDCSIFTSLSSSENLLLHGFVSEHVNLPMHKFHEAFAASADDLLGNSQCALGALSSLDGLSFGR